jgi:hypothetical protein
MINENKKLNAFTLKMQKRPLFNSPQTSTSKNIFNLANIQTGSKLKSTNRLREKYNTFKNDDDITQNFNSEKTKSIDSKNKIQVSLCKNI